MSRYHCFTCGNYCAGDYGYCSEECEAADEPTDDEVLRQRQIAERYGYYKLIKGGQRD